MALVCQEDQRVDPRDEQHHETREPAGMGGKKSKRLLATLRCQPVIAVGDVGPLRFKARENPDEENHQRADARAECQRKQEIAAARHPTVGTIIRAEVGRDYCGKAVDRHQHE